MGSHTNGRARSRGADREAAPGEQSRTTDRDPADARRVMDALRRIVQGLRLAGRAAEKRFGLSAAQLFVLHKLADGQAASLNELAARTLTHQSSVSVVVQRLVEKELVQRTASRADARRLVLSLTPEGRQLVRRSPQASQQRLIEAISRLDAARLRTLAGLLERIADDALGASGTRPPMFFSESGPPRRAPRQKHVTQ